MSTTKKNNSIKKQRLNLSSEKELMNSVEIKTKLLMFEKMQSITEVLHISSSNKEVRKVLCISGI